MSKILMLTLAATTLALQAFAADTVSDTHVEDDYTYSDEMDMDSHDHEHMHDDDMMMDDEGDMSESDMGEGADAMDMEESATH